MKSFTNHLGITIMCWELAVVVIATNLYLIYEFTVTTYVNAGWWLWTTYAVVGFFYFMFLAYIVITPKKFQAIMRRCGCKVGCCPYCEVPEDVEFDQPISN